MSGLIARAEAAFAQGWIGRRRGFGGAVNRKAAQTADQIAPLLDQPHMQIVSFLKDTHAMGHGHANAIVAHQLAKNKGA